MTALSRHKQPRCPSCEVRLHGHSSWFRLAISQKAEASYQHTGTSRFGNCPGGSHAPLHLLPAQAPLSSMASTDSLSLVAKESSDGSSRTLVNSLSKSVETSPTAGCKSATRSRKDGMESQFRAINAAWRGGSGVLLHKLVETQVFIKQTAEENTLLRNYLDLTRAIRTWRSNTTEVGLVTSLH